MTSSNYDVAIVGAGAAGVTAAIGLARAGFRVVALEAASFPGAENWSGCVYFCENLAHPEILGPDGVEALAWERRVVERGFFATDGHGLLGMTYRDPSAFRHCYTVLRPIYDQHLAHVAQRHGAAILSETTAENLIRDDGRVIGVCTNRGPIYADLVFLAEGDASHLVTREGYERSSERRAAPKFLQGIKQVIDLPPGAIEEIFGVGPEEGVAYEMLVRNGTLRGRPLHLNMGGFIYTNRQSLSVGLVLPADNLHDAFGGDPNLLVEWFEGLPALAPWLKQGKRGVFGAKLIRGGGAKDIPRLTDDGLAIGGAASAIGIDFPYPNFTGPATAMGLLLVQAACRIRDESAGRRRPFSREQLDRHYLEPLRRTHYWQDVEFLRRWPGYVKRSRMFFGRHLDVALGSAYLWTRPRRGVLRRWRGWVRMLLHVAGPGHWSELRSDLQHLSRALRVAEVTHRPALGRLLLDGTVNALRDLFRRPRANLPAAGKVRLHYTVGGGSEPSAPPPGVLRRWFARFSPVLACAAQRMYANEPTPLDERLALTTRLVMRQVNLLDFLVAGTLGLGGAATAVLLVGSNRLARLWRRGPARVREGSYESYTRAARQATDLTPVVSPAAQTWEARLARLAYDTGKQSHIHVLWPQNLAEKDAVTRQGLWRVCPAHVYEARVSPLGQLQVVVNFENCIKCETCWRTSDQVDWARDGTQRFVYPVASPAVGRLLSDADQPTGAPAEPLALDPWQDAGQAGGPPSIATDGQVIARAEIERLLEQIEQKVDEFDHALGEEPRTIDRARAEYLEMLARYVAALAARIQEQVPILGSSLRDGDGHRSIVRLASAMVSKAEERARRAWGQRYAWAAADGRQIRDHFVTGLRRLLNLAVPARPSAGPNVAPSRPWLRAEDDAARLRDQAARWSARLDAVLPPGIWRELDRGGTLSPEQNALVRELMAEVPVVDTTRLQETLHPPARKVLLAELARRDPSLAYRVACHLWARDLAGMATAEGPVAGAAQRWRRGAEWAGLVLSENALQGEVLFVPAGGAQTLLLLAGDLLTAVPTNTASLAVTPLPTLGLRGAGLSAVRVGSSEELANAARVDGSALRGAWHVLSALDLVSIAAGMADVLCERTLGHATSRVQFPGLFHDEEARDTIGKFGAVKKMVAEMGARRYLIETLDHNLVPRDFSASSAAVGSLVKALVAELLGTAPGSLSYNAGQVFGGTGYSEDDILSKFYRDSAAWRFLGPSNAQVWSAHAREVTQNSGLSRLPDEVALFDELTQRKALQAELDEVRNLRSRLKALLAPAQNAPTASPKQEPSSAAGGPLPDEMAEAIARQDAQLLASKALLLRTHARLEHGMPAEVEISLLRVWLDGVSASLDELEAAMRRKEAAAPAERPLLEPTAAEAVRNNYADFLAAPLPYRSGDFLGNPIDLLQPRYVPEMVAADPDLAAQDRAYRELLLAHFGAPRDGLCYERYIERQHRPDPEDLDFCRQHGFFRMPIPRELGGEQSLKASYYLLTTNAQRLVDVAISLTIQANTSIGTTPVLLARDKDLPRALEELAAFRADVSLQAEIARRLEELTRLVDTREAAAIEKKYLALQKDLSKAVLGKAALRVLAHRFTSAWQGAGQAGLAFDLDGMRSRLEEARACWREACSNAEEFHSELQRRLEAGDLFLRWVAAGQISAFALTEPSAGSDTARVATRAKLHSVPVEPRPDGSFQFTPAGGGDSRRVLDARRLVFRDHAAFYRWSDHAEPAPFRFDEYDYETDDPARMRFYEADGRRVHFTDVAQLRERGGRLWYDYWGLTGAKMWITNGRMSGIMCLYAKTDMGVTGFIVDRHAEGLVVGKDEAKMGQLGSPTNELSLQAVRVPRENVIGLEGRGQVNALETLNVGRAGLAMSAMAQMRGLIDSSRAFAEKAYGGIPDWVAWRLRRMEEECFISEAVAFEVIGRFEHPHTKSVRMESAIAKMLVSELLHHVIELAEEVHGLDGQTERHFVEKRKRDARILNIYEGTNEVQRFTILKDLVGEVAPRWAKEMAPPQHLGREVLELEHLKRALRQRVEAALAAFGQGLWQNPNLQANCFLLAEAVAWLKAADSTLGRLAWIIRHAPADDAESSPAALLARAALSRCHAETNDRLRRFDEELTHLRRGYYAPEVRAAALMFRYGPASPAQAGQSTATSAVRSRVDRPLRVLVIAEPAPGPLPELRVAEGRLLEPHLTVGEAAGSALEIALRVRDAARSPVRIVVAAVGPRAAAACLRDALSLGADDVRLLVPPTHAVTAASAALALASVLREEPGFDLVLGGDERPGEEGAMAILAAQALGLPYAGSAADLAVSADGNGSSIMLIGSDGRQKAVRPLPAAAAIQADVALRSFRIAGYLAGASRRVEIYAWPQEIVARPSSFAPAARTEDAGRTEDVVGNLSPEQAADRLLGALGQRSGPGGGHEYEGPIEAVDHPALLGPGSNGALGVIAVLAADGQGRLRPGAGAVVDAAGMAAEHFGCSVGALVLTPDEESYARRLMGQLRERFRGDVLLIRAADACNSDQVIGRVLEQCWPSQDFRPRAVVAEAWAEIAVPSLAARAARAATVALRVRRVGCESGDLVLETSRQHGKLWARQRIDAHERGPVWLCLIDDAEAAQTAGKQAAAAGRVRRWSPRLQRFFGRADVQQLLGELKAEAGITRLADADFIVDVGYGVGNRDGYEAVVEPLVQAVRALGVRNVMVGGSRKVTEELHLLPADRQIGQSGVSVNPQILLAIGISGAPQHLNYIGPRATVLAFNRDPEAPLLTLNQRQARPRVLPVVGDLFETVPALIAALQHEEPVQTEPGVSRPNGNAPSSRPSAAAGHVE